MSSTHQKLRYFQSEDMNFLEEVLQAYCSKTAITKESPEALRVACGLIGMYKAGVRCPELLLGAVDPRMRKRRTRQNFSVSG